MQISNLNISYIKLSYIYSCMNKELITGGLVLFTFICSMNYLINEFFGPSESNSSNSNTEITKVEQHQILMTPINQVDQIENEQIDQVDQIENEQIENEHCDQNKDFSTILDNILKPMIDIMECNVNNELLPIEKIIDRKNHLLHLNQRLTLIKEHLQQLKEDLIK